MSMASFVVTETHGEGIACYIRNDLSYNVKSYFPKDRKYLNCYYQTLT